MRAPLMLLLLVAVAAAAPAAGGATVPGRCSSRAAIAAEHVLAANHLSARVVRVQQRSIPSFEPNPAPGRKRLYLVTFDLLKPNLVLGRGRHSLFAYVTRPKATAPWCYLKGGSGP